MVGCDFHETYRIGCGRCKDAQYNSPVEVLSRDCAALGARVAELEAQVFKVERAAARHKNNYHAMQEACTQRDRVIHEEQQCALGWQKRAEDSEARARAAEAEAKRYREALGHIARWPHAQFSAEIARKALEGGE